MGCGFEGCPVKRGSFNFPNQKPGKFCAKHKLEGMVDVKHKNSTPKKKRKNKQPPCKFQGCLIKRSIFNYPDQKSGKYCSNHKLSGMVDVINRKCEHIDENGKKCTKIPSFGNSGERKRCAQHKLLGMTENVSIKCDYIGNDKKQCTLVPCYNFPNEKFSKRCKNHAIDGMVDITHKKCSFVSPNGKTCNVRPNFNFPHEKSPSRCAKHLDDGMVDITHKKCEVINCPHQSIFNFPTEFVGIRCKEHIINGMVNVKSKKCEFLGCDRYPSFNFEGLPPCFCKKHIVKGMINVKDARCNFETCTTRPCFGYPEGSPERCGKHQTKGMIDLTCKWCEFENCDVKYPRFNYKNEKQGRFCKSHKLEDMINVRSKKCNQCNNRVSYGKLFESKTHCGKHKLANEFTNNKPICEEDECIEKAFYTNDGTNYPHRCEDHKLRDDINIVEKPCSNCGLSYFLNDETRLCNDCNDFIVRKVHKVKETTVLEFLKSKGIMFESEDRIPENGCAKYRPDGVIDFLYFKVILEIDENQHKGYTDKCEITRMIQLHQDFGGLPIIFIRYNPDSYKDINRKIIKPNSRRLSELYDVLRSLEILKNDYEKNNTKLPSLSAIYMFYDDYSSVAKLEAIDILKEVREL